MSTLFTAVSVEQQEIVAGGTLAALNATVYSIEEIGVAAFGSSGPSGSSGGTVGGSKRLGTGQLSQIADGLSLFSPTTFPRVPSAF